MISLGLDIGGTGCKCVAFSEDGRELAKCYEEYPLAPGADCLPPAALSGSVFSVIKGCVGLLSDPNEVVAVTLSSFGESYVAVDEDNNPLDDIHMYFANTPNMTFERLVDKVGEQTFRDICHLPAYTYYSLSKMLETREAASKPIHKFLLISGYIGYLLSGRAATDDSLAAQTLLYDFKSRAWSEKLLGASGFSEDQMPEIVPYGSSLGRILPDMAKKLGLPESTLIVMGAQDQIVNALGAGVEHTGDAVASTGTTECITALFPEPPADGGFIDDNYCCLPYPGDRGYVTYAYNISAGSVIRWYRDALAGELRQAAKETGKNIYDLMNESAPSEPTSLLVLPYLQGMGGTPDLDARATGLIAGLTTKTRLPDIYRAILEGVTFEMRYNQEKLKKYGITFDRLFACGGGSRSPVWLQIKADILKCDILPVETEETGAMGCAVMGFAAVTGEDMYSIAGRFRKYKKTVTPNPAHLDIYDRKYEEFKKLRAKLPGILT